MNQFNSHKYDIETVRVGFGNTWESMYEYPEEFDRLVVGGRAPTVGLTTLIGGGLSHLSNRYGFASDNAISFELLAANGTSIIVSTTSNQDLFFSLKVGSNSFGILTHATLRTYEVKKVWGGAVIYANEYRDQVMLAFAAYQRSGQYDRDSALISYMGINNNTLYVTMVYLNPTERPAAFEPFDKIPSVFDGTRIHDSFTDLINEQVDFVVPRWTWGVSTFYLDADLYVDVTRICQNASTSLASINGGIMVLLPQPVSTSMIFESITRDKNPMVSGLDRTAQLWFSINFGWKFVSDDSKIQAILLSTFEKTNDLTKKRGKYSQFLFQNDAYSTQDPLRSYGMNAFRKLEKVSREVDPEKVFQKNVPSDLKLNS